MIWENWKPWKNVSFEINYSFKVNPAAEIECASAADVIRNYENARQVLEQFKSVSGSVSDSLGGETNTESSHMFFKIILEQRNGLSGKKSSVTFVDLASRWVDLVVLSVLFFNLIHFLPSKIGKTREIVDRKEM